MADLFNNPTNNYVNPSITPCVGNSDNMNLTLVKNGLGIVSGNNVLERIDFGDLKVPVSSFTKQNKILGPQEIIFIPGLTKGLQEARQVFNYLPDTSINYFTDTIDLSVTYILNFKTIIDNISVTGNEEQNITFIDALNLEFGNKQLQIKASDDPSSLIFEALNEGYLFEINNVYWNNNLLEEDKDRKIDFIKYPNGAMQSIVLKTTFPQPSPDCPFDRYLLINHVDNPIIKYDKITIDNYISGAEAYFDINFDPSTEWECGIIEPSIYDERIIILPQEPVIEDNLFNELFINLILTPKRYSQSIDGSIINNEFLTRYNIYNSNINNSLITDSNILHSIVLDTSLDEIYSNDLNGQNLLITNSELENSSIFDSSIYNSKILRLNLELDATDNGNYISFSIIEDAKLSDSEFLNSIGNFINFSYSNIVNSKLYESNLNHSVLTDTSIINSEINNGTINNTLVNNSNIIDSILNNVKLNINFDRLINDVSIYYLDN